MKKTTLLFTPYGYKFEEEASGWDSSYFYENYKSSGVEWPEKKPWHFGNGGLVSLRTDGSGVYDITSAGRYWNITNYRNIDRLAYELSFNPTESHPSGYNERACGLSVRKK